LSILGFVEKSSSVLNAFTRAGQVVTLFEISKEVVNLTDKIDQQLVKVDPYIL